MTRTGKIARLPQKVQEQLNRRLDDHETGKNLVVWLNSLPEVQSVMTAEFGGAAVREQNLSEWKQGGYRDWQRRQERGELFRQIQPEMADWGLKPEEVHQKLATVLMADLALAVRETMEQISDPVERTRCLAQLAGKMAQLRREESYATRIGVVRERWDDELAKAEQYKRSGAQSWPHHALFMQRMYLDMLGGNDVGTNPTESGSIRPATAAKN